MPQDAPSDFDPRRQHSESAAAFYSAHEPADRRRLDPQDDDVTILESPVVVHERDHEGHTTFLKLSPFGYPEGA